MFDHKKVPRPKYKWGDRVKLCVPMYSRETSDSEVCVRIGSIYGVWIDEDDGQIYYRIYVENHKYTRPEKEITLELAGT